MNKALNIALLLFLAVSIPGQQKQPSTKRSKPAQPGKQTAGAVKKPVKKAATGTTRKPTATTRKKAKPDPEPTPVDPEADRKRFDEAVAAPTTAEKAVLLRSFLDKFPESELREEAYTYLVTARAVVANDLVRAGNAAAGIASFKSAVEEAPLPVPDRLFTDVLLKIPGTLFYGNNRPAAIELASLIEKKVAASPKQLLGVAAFYLGIENGAEAKRVAEAAIAVDPNSAAAYHALGLAHRLNFDLEEAAKAYAKALELDGTSAAARRGLAEMNRALAKPEPAVAAYREILAANENDAAARHGLILSLFDNGQLKEAEAELDRTLQSEPRNFALLTSVAYWYAAHEQADKAVGYAQKAVDIEPRYIWAHIVLARGLMKQRKPVDAERTLIRAKQYGNFPTLDYEMASARFQAGLYREAVEELQKSFTIKDGLIGTRLGGRVYREEKNFQDLLAYERKASLLQPLPADSEEASEKLRLLFQLTRRLEQSADETELTALADEFVDGSDKMKLHRQLYVANLFLQRGVALGKVAELVKASVGNADTGLDVAAPGAAVMASELYESRNVALSRNEVLVIPEVPRQTLSAILRGRIEELAGWIAFQQKNYPEAIVRLKRSVSVLPDKSAWWRSSMWRLGAALEADGKDKEALDSYIKSYVTDRPSATRYGVIEALYRKVNGTTDGLEDKIGANPIVAMASVEPKPSERTEAKSEPDQNASAKNVPVSEPPPTPPMRRFPRNVPVENATAGRPAQTGSASGNSSAANEKTDAGTGNEKSGAAGRQERRVADILDAKRYESTTQDAKTEAPEPATATRVGTSAEQMPEASPVTTVEEPPSLKVLPKAAETRIETSPQTSTTPPAEVKDPPLVEKEKETSSSPSPKDIAAEPSGNKTDAVPLSAEKQLGPVKKDEPAKKGDENTGAKQPNVKETASETNIRPVETQRTDPAEPPKRDETTVVKETEPSKSAENVKPEGEAVATDPKKTEGVNTIREPSDNTGREPVKSSGEPSKSTERAETKPPLIIISDRFKSDPKPVRPKTKELFEPIIITVPGPPAGKQKEAPVDKRGLEKNADAADEKPMSEAEPETAATRRRVIQGKEIVSDQRCSIVLSQDTIMLLSGGGSLGLLVRIDGDGDMNDVTASSTSSRDVEVRPEPEIEGITGRRFFMIKSISDKVGVFQVNFESPCGKREVTVHVR